jgi:hypothetical protein
MSSIDKTLICIFTFIFTSITLAQLDTIVVSSGDILVGDMKNMSRGVVTIETPYSDSDFKIEWAKVIKVNSKGAFIVSRW